MLYNYILYTVKEIFSASTKSPHIHAVKALGGTSKVTGQCDWFPFSKSKVFAKVKVL